MKSSNIVTLLTATTALSPSVVSSFEIHTEELLSHSILARLILESPSRRAAIATRQSNAMAFLEKKAVEPQLAFLSERDVYSSSSSISSQEQSPSSDAVEDAAEQEQEEKPQQQQPLAFGLAPR